MLNPFRNKCSVFASVFAYQREETHNPQPHVNEFSPMHLKTSQSANDAMTLGLLSVACQQHIVKELQPLQLKVH